MPTALRLEYSSLKNRRENYKIIDQSTFLSYPCIEGSITFQNNQIGKNGLFLLLLLLFLTDRNCFVLLLAFTLFLKITV